MSSSHFKMLKDVDQSWYIEKLSFNGFQLPDPLDEDLRKKVYTSKKLPNIDLIDIYVYLVQTHNIYTRLAFKNHETLPCYNYVASQKVKELKCYYNEIGVCVTTALIETSRKAKKIHSSWIVSTHDGKVLSGHCTCMVELGETCSHVGAILFFIEKTVREEKEKPSCTSKPCTWNRTSKNVEPALVADTDFMKPKKVKKTKSKQEINSLPVASDAEYKTFLQNVKKAVPNAVIFSVLSDSEIF